MADLSVAQIERLLAEKKALLDGLNKRRDRPIRKTRAGDSRIKDIGGEVPTGERPKRSRLQNERSLYDVVTDVLQEYDDGLTPSELAKAVLAAGTRATASSLPIRCTNVCTTLRKRLCVILKTTGID